jgi:hypothetical protein
MITFKQFQSLEEAALQEEVVQLDEISMSRLHAHTQGRNIGMITAWRSEHPDHPDWDKVKDLHKDDPKKKSWLLKVNKARNKELEGSIKDYVKTHPKHKVGYTKVRGRYVEKHGTPEAKDVDEHSFLIMGKKGNDKNGLKHFLEKHGKKYDQDSILHKAHNSNDAHLIGTNHSKFPGYEQHANVGEFHPNRTPEFHSVLHGGGINSGKQGLKTIRQKGTGVMTTRTGPASDKKWAHEHD